MTITKQIVGKSKWN